MQIDKGFHCNWKTSHAEPTSWNRYVDWFQSNLKSFRHPFNFIRKMLSCKNTGDQSFLVVPNPCKNNYRRMSHYQLYRMRIIPLRCGINRQFFTHTKWFFFVCIVSLIIHFLSLTKTKVFKTMHLRTEPKFQDMNYDLETKNKTNYFCQDSSLLSTKRMNKKGKKN